MKCMVKDVFSYIRSDSVKENTVLAVSAGAFLSALYYHTRVEGVRTFSWTIIL